MLESRPVYRHLIVNRRGLTSSVASPEAFQRLRAQLQAKGPIDEDLSHLYVQDTLKKTVQQVLRESGLDSTKAEAHSDGVPVEFIVAEASGSTEPTFRYQPQEGVVVSRLNTNQVPGGDNEPLPEEVTMLHHAGFTAHAMDGATLMGEYLRCATQLQEQFTQFSDRQFLTADPDLLSTVTLVTVCVTPIILCPSPVSGAELICEFHQVTRFGYVDTTGFEVLSEVGAFPIDIPSVMNLKIACQPA